MGIEGFEQKWRHQKMEQLKIMYGGTKEQPKIESSLPTKTDAPQLTPLTPDQASIVEFYEKAPSGAIDPNLLNSLPEERRNEAIQRKKEFQEEVRKNFLEAVNSIKSQIDH